MSAVTGYVFLACRQENVDQDFALYGCPADSIIYIGSATVGHSRNIAWSQNQCYLVKNITCQKRTYHHEIMRCNGRQHCSFSRLVFNQSCWWQKWHNINAIYITYNCIDGEIMILLFAIIR